MAQPMYGLSDQLKLMPLTRFSADLQGSSRYSARTRRIIGEHMFVYDNAWMDRVEPGIRV